MPRATGGAKKKVKKKATRKPAKKAPAKKKTTKRKPPAAFMKPLKPDAVLAAIVGSKPMPRTQIVKKIWEYIKKKNLQDPAQGQYILAKKDAAMRKFLGADRVSMFAIASAIKKHVS